MTEPKLADSMLNLSRALLRLREALEVPSDQALAVDGTIQRFEFVIELCCKTLKRMLAFEGIDTTTPREAVVQAFAVGLIDNETAWLDMLRDCSRDGIPGALGPQRNAVCRCGSGRCSQSCCSRSLSSRRTWPASA